jgi:type I restriction enzyme, R subunit
MPKPSEHKTVQSRILKYAQETGWNFVARAEAEKRRGFDVSIFCRSYYIHRIP